MTELDAQSGHLGTEVGTLQGPVKVTEGPGEVGGRELGLAPPTQEHPFPN